MNNVTVVLLSGGTSSRFWPLPHKMSLQFLGKSFIERQIEQLKNCGFTSIVVVSNSKLGMASISGVTTITQKGEGQGAAILSAAGHIKTKQILVVNADDLVSPLLYKKILEISGENKNILVGYKTNRYFPGGYLVLNGKKIAHIVEKPGEGNEPSSFVRLVCDYFPNADILTEFLGKIPNAHADTHYEETLTAMMKSGEFFEMLEYEDVWIPVKYPWHTLTLMDHYLSQIKRSSIAKSAYIHKTATISGPVIIENNVRILEYAKLTGPLYIGRNSIVGNHTLIRYSIIGENSVVGFSSDVTRSYLGQNVWLHSNYVGDSVLSNNVAMGAGSILANLRLDEGEIFSDIKGDRTRTYKNKLGALIGEGSKIGVSVQVMPGVKVGAGGQVGAGVLLQQDLPDKKKCFLRQNHTIIDNNTLENSDREGFRKKI